MVKLPPVRKRQNYSDLRSDDLVFALFWDRALGDPGAMREAREMAPIVATKTLGLTLDNLLIRFKHGKHDQRSHGRRTARRAAAQATYSAARAGGASVKDARTAAREVSDLYRRNQRIANIDRALEATSGMSQRQRASLEAERARLHNEVQNAYWSRFPAGVRQAPGVDEQINAAMNTRPEARTRGPADARLRDYQGRLQASQRERDAINNRLSANQRELDYINRRLATETLTPGGRKGLEKERARIEKERRRIEKERRDNEKLLNANHREVERELARQSATPRKAKQDPQAKARAFEDKIRSQDYESALVLDRNGNPILEKDGGSNFVSFTDAEIARIRASQGVVMTHNHPGGLKYPPGNPARNGNSFSPEDIDMATAVGAAEMRAVTPTRRYYVKAPPGGWDEAYYKQEIEPRYRRYNQSVKQDFTRRISEGSMTIDQANGSHYHVVWSQVFGDLGIEYGYTED